MNVHTHVKQNAAAPKEGDAVLPSQAEVIKSRKPIKKMINIHVGDASPWCRWDGISILHVHMYNGSSERCSSACCNCGVLGGGDQEVNMIQSSSFISGMKAITLCRAGEGLPCGLKVILSTYKPACKLHKPTRAG